MAHFASFFAASVAFVVPWMQTL